MVYRRECSTVLCTSARDIPDLEGGRGEEGLWCMIAQLRD